MGLQAAWDGTGGATLGLVVHPTRPFADSVATIVEWAASHSLGVIARDQDRKRMAPDVPAVPDPQFLDRVDGIVSLGGDGTMLGAMRLVMERPVPVLGVNHGTLGFLVEITPTRLEAALAQLTRGDFSIEAHSCLLARAAHGAEGAEAGPVGLDTDAGFNDVVLARLGRAGAVSVDLAVNGQQYGYYTCDALVLCTPTGSTAYNYAAGGPVLSPAASAIVVTPVAPMAGISRAVVLGPEDEVSLHVAADGARVAVEVDGTPSGTLGAGDTVTVRLRDSAAQVVRLSPGTYAHASRLKLSLLDLPLRRDQLLELVPEHLRDLLDADRVNRPAGPAGSTVSE